MMLNSLRKLKSRTRPILPALLIVILLFVSACSSHKKVVVPQLLTPLADANSSQLIAEVNRLAGIKSIHGKFDIQFQDTSFASAGIAEKYRSADANIIVQRPGKVYLVIQAFFVDIAAMASDGEHFSVALLKGDEKYRRFAKGTNSANYGELKANGSVRKSDKANKAEGETVSALSNLRPQHLTDALLIRPIVQPSESGLLLYSQSEFYQEEPDLRPRAGKGVHIVRGYYLLEELSPTASGEARLRRRFWFDRVGTIRLARLQSFDDHGLLETDVSYGDDVTVGEGTTAKLPSHIELTRPKDEYKLSLTYQTPNSVEVDKIWQPDVFVLQNKWGLPEIDLDANKGTRAKTSP